MSQQTIEMALYVQRCPLDDIDVTQVDEIDSKEIESHHPRSPLVSPGLCLTPIDDIDFSVLQTDVEL